MELLLAEDSLVLAGWGGGPVILSLRTSRGLQCGPLPLPVVGIPVSLFSGTHNPLLVSRFACRGVPHRLAWPAVHWIFAPVHCQVAFQHMDGLCYTSVHLSMDVSAFLGFVNN